jgi:hypothetical protein
MPAQHGATQEPPVAHSGAGDDGMTKRSDQQIALRRRPARVSRIGRLPIAAEVIQYPLDDGRILDAGNDLELPATTPADCKVDKVN